MSELREALAEATRDIDAALDASVTGGQMVRRARLALSTLEALALESTGTGADEAELRKIVERTARMGICSQTHHEHLMVAARKALAPRPAEPTA